MNSLQSKINQRDRGVKLGCGGFRFLVSMSRKRYEITQRVQLIGIITNRDLWICAKVDDLE